MSRIDLHRPSVMIPAQYSFVTTFAHARFDLDGELVDEGFGFDEVDAFLSTHTGAVFGNARRCGSCGAQFLQGALWVHGPSGEALFTGRDCADNMMLVADWTAVEVAAKRAADLRKLAVQRTIKAKAIADLFAANEGLEDALGTSYTGGRRHRILADLSSRLRQWGGLSPAQISLAFKIAAEVEVRNTQPQEVLIAAPSGRVKLTGNVVSLKVQESDYGTVIKATVRVESPDGVWYCWVSQPSAAAWSRGDTVTVKATVKPSDDRLGWGWGSRPTLA